MMQPRSASTHSKINSMMRLSNWSMSSVWLTARAVRYITWRLLRARASQEFCGKSAWVSKIRLPSFCVTEWMIRDWSSGAAAAAISTELPILAVRFVGGPRVEHQRRPHLHLVATDQNVLLHPLPVDEGAVGAVQVGDRVIAMRAAELGVMARDFGIVHVDSAGLVASEPQDRLLQLITRALVISANYKQRRHDCRFPPGALSEPVRQPAAEGWRRLTSAEGGCNHGFNRALAAKGDSSHPLRPTFRTRGQDFFDSTN